ncbi:transcriptional regulator [Jannaschia pagri]|uniref:Transcriptional regulator n=1 Tax=Jannaschia pagri TaxID=2829797 RepID=A0ABQ4NLY1_9RHOB|nr:MULTISPECIES: metalloregulator ArsR/SmtB family transcription factor [unclassified Jannaschia]GIT91589.1 transcriptional regulator [Jannaschia sp. AI_61]GIT95423.1 transcriptional regulator [Jannaschia sp. AI_62]
MDKISALRAFSALGQETRLDVLRLLIQAGPEGMAAGDLVTTLGVRQNTLSANLGVLLNAGLVRNQREGRSIRYFVDLEGVRGLLGFLLRDCCGGRPDVCQPLLDDLARAT